MPRLHAVLFAFGLLVLNVVPAWAHKVNLFAYAEGGKVYTESFFPDGRKVEAGKIEVQDGRGKVLLKGATDSQGLFAFPLPADKQDLTITVNAGLGHKNSFVLKKEDM